MPDTLNRVAQPRALLFRQTRLQPHEVQLVAQTQVLRFVEEQHLRRRRRKAPSRVLYGPRHWDADERIARYDPLLARTIVEQDVEPEARFRAQDLRDWVVRRRPLVDMPGCPDRARAVPQSGRRARHLDPALRPGGREVVRDERQAAQGLEDRA